MHRHFVAKNLFRSDFLASFGVAVCLTAPCGATEPPEKSLLIFIAEQTEPPIQIGPVTSAQDTTDNIVLHSDSVKESSAVVDDVETETIRERFPSGVVRVERSVALDEEGNYVNHGAYSEWNDKGQLIVSGTYRMGKREGQWLQFIFKPTTGIFLSMPYSEYETPFTSEASFQNDELEGSWKIADAKGRIVSTIDFEDGMRSGIANWYFANGKPFFESLYAKGFLIGDAFEYNKDGTEKRHDFYKSGQRADVKREFYKDNKPKSEFEYLTPIQVVKSKDDWVNSKMAVYESQGEVVKHGKFSVWHENGNLRAQGYYKMNQIDGDYQSWHPSGDRESKGKFVDGSMQGPWSWWHANGMKRASGIYAEGKPDGNWRAWNLEGKLVKQEVFEMQDPAVPTPDVEPKEKTARMLYDLIR